MINGKRIGVTIGVLVSLAAGMAAAEEKEGLPQVRASATDQEVLGSNTVHAEPNPHVVYDICPVLLENERTVVKKDGATED
jgi:hypothetical protein